MITLPSSIRDWEGPAVQAMICSPAEGYGIAWAFDENHGLSRVLRASKMSTHQDLFNEFGAALQFGDYFGENWDAFNECINDLDWIEAAAYLLVIVDAESLLTADPDRDVAIFFKILNEAAAAWLDPEAFPGFDGRTPHPFNVLLQVSADGLNALERLRARGNVPLPVIDVGDFLERLRSQPEQA